MKGLSEHEVFIFLLQFAVLLALARVLGALAQKLRQPTVLGELLAGILLGPAVLGHVWPEARNALFPQTPTQEHLLEMLSWLGMVLLIFRTGLEVDLRLWSFLGRAAILTSILGIVIPFATGFEVGRLLPEGLLVRGGDRVVFALFLATAMSISAVKVIAKTLLELKLMRRDIGAVILAASMTDDTIGWVLLSIVSAIAMSGAVNFGSVLHPVLATAGFLVFAAFVARPLLRRLIGWIERGERLEHATTSAIIVVTLAFAAITQRLGIHAVFGAFVAGVLISEQPRVRHATLEALDSVILGVFAPVFFVYTGLKVSTLQLPPAGITLLILGVAILGKVIGAGLGARLGGLSWGSALAVGVGMSSRGSMELVVARIGMDLGVLSQSLYAAIVLIPMVTSLSTPALLRFIVRTVKPDARESKRLEEEAENERAVMKREGTKILVALSGGPRSFQAMRMAAPLARLPGATLVAMSVVPENGAASQRSLQRRSVLTEEASREILERFRAEQEGRDPLDFHPSVVSSPSPVAALSEEMKRGYDLVFVGAGRRRTVSNRLLTSAIEDGSSDVVVLYGDTFPKAFRRILLATDGHLTGRGAAELSVLYAKAEHARVTALHVIDAPLDVAGQVQEKLRGVGERLVGEATALGEQHGVPVESRVWRGANAARCILAAASETGSDLIVLGATPRVLGRSLYLGNTVEFVLAHAQCAVALFVPGRRRAGAKAA